jgi:transposase
LQNHSYSKARAIRRFNSWLKTRLCPRLTPEHLVIMDNAAFHKSPETAHLIHHTGATLLFLPPYSPT